MGASNNAKMRAFKRLKHQSSHLNILHWSAKNEVS